MAQHGGKITCGACGRTMTEDSQWIALDGGDVWCSDCWSMRFGGQAPVLTVDTGPDPGADAAADYAAGAAPYDGTSLVEVSLDDMEANAGGGQHSAQSEPPPGPAQPPASNVLHVVHAVAPPTAITVRRTSGLAVTSFVLSLVGLFLFAGLLGPLAIIFGAISLSSISQDPRIGGKGLAIAGLVIGIVETVICLVLVYFFWAFILAAMSV